MGSTKRLNNCFVTDNQNNLYVIEYLGDIDITQNIAIAGEERRSHSTHHMDSTA